MKEIQTDIILNATIADVWQTLIDIENWSAWNPFIINATGQVSLGSTLKNTLLNNGRRITFKPVITALIPEKKFAWRGSALAGGLVGEHYFLLDEIENKQVKLTHGEVFSGWLVWLIFPLLYKQTEAGFHTMNEALKLRLNT